MIHSWYTHETNGHVLPTYRFNCILVRRSAHFGIWDKQKWNVLQSDKQIMARILFCALLVLLYQTRDYKYEVWRVLFNSKMWNFKILVWLFVYLIRSVLTSCKDRMAQKTSRFPSTINLRRFLRHMTVTKTGKQIILYPSHDFWKWVELPPTGRGIKYIELPCLTQNPTAHNLSLLSLFSPNLWFLILVVLKVFLFLINCKTKTDNGGHHGNTFLTLGMASRTTRNKNLCFVGTGLNFGLTILLVHRVAV